MRTTFTFACICLITAGCASDTEDDASASTEELSSAVTTEAAIVAATTTDETDAETAAATAAETLSALFEECAEATVSGASVSWTLTDCTGPWGLAGIDGTIEATYRPASGGLAATVAVDLTTAEGASLEVDADVTYAATAAGTTLEVTSTGHGVGPRGTAATRSGTYTVVVEGGSCLSVDGRWDGGAADAWSLEVDGYRVCTDGCPTGTVTRSGRVDATLSFDGTASATFSSEARTVAIPLVCGG